MELQRGTSPVLESSAGCLAKPLNWASSRIGLSRPAHPANRCVCATPPGTAERARLASYSHGVARHRPLEALDSQQVQGITGTDVRAHVTYGGERQRYRAVMMPPADA
ncbi:hypothetical protein NDU88_005407 [Pleurodeles waltl]|uniref:Uncharacterized protein n=1 Tax=Pleurodeles waltl TaxID=8319 RepID=A0AAV7NMG9_PLEWA|nr:hypothetical protein NDU88_005407 [Pleurodeles waltl]